ncbi:Hsp70 family protein [Krasilnikovia sp. MM14-A1259]|uniref:Hsp70 family protein n=1 Tax=Krasilnikovia sp. MM14-A1259 TaxID=3373539 RepID=UPI00381CB1F5
MYALGIDLGTTFTAAAIWRDGRAETVSLGDRSAAIRSVVLLREDETFLTGDAAHRRGFSEPQRVAREFKRRLGDTTPILLGGVPQSAEALMSRLLRSVVDEVARREGGRPAAICVSHPANWGPYKLDLLRQAVRMADLDLPVTYTTEPEAAAVNYTQQQRVEPGTVVAVYDLGGGTFDAAVLRKTPSGFEVLGQPEGIERLGGTDFDAAVFNHVRTALDGKLEELDEDDPAAINAVIRLREECVQAKEALSSDTDTTIPVLLPNVSTDVRLTRAEFEAMVRPALHGSVEALQRALRSADCSPEQVHSVLLVGGSSRMPIVAQLVGSELGRPVAVDAHPKHAVALGAARLAGGDTAKSTGPGPVPPGRQAASAGVVRQQGAPGQIGAPMGAPGPQGAPTGGPRPQTAPTGAPGPQTASTGTPGPQGAPTGGPRPQGAPTGAPGPQGVPMGAPGQQGAPAGAARQQVGPAIVPGGQTARPNPAGGTAPAGGPAPAAYGAPVTPNPSSPAGAAPAARSRTYTSTTAGPAGAVVSPEAEPPAKRTWSVLVAAGAVLVVLLGGGAAAWALRSGNRAGGAKPAAVPDDEQCTAAIKANPRWVCLTSARIADGKFIVEYDADFGGSQPAVKGGYHLHIYGGNGTTPPDTIEGEQAPDDQKGFWYVEDQRPSVVETSDVRFVKAIGDAPKVCARIADSHHGLVPDSHGTYKTGNCVPIKR